MSRNSWSYVSLSCPFMSLTSGFENLKIGTKEPLILTPFYSLVKTWALWLHTKHASLHLDSEKSRWFDLQWAISIVPTNWKVAISKKYLGYSISIHGTILLRFKINVMVLEYFVINLWVKLYTWMILSKFYVYKATISKL